MTKYLKNMSRWAKVTLVVSLSLLIFALQIEMDSNPAVVILYGVPLLLTFFFRRSRASYFYAFIFNLLIIIGILVKYDANSVSKQGPFLLSVMLILWMTAYSIQQLKKDTIRTEAQKKRYEQLSSELSMKLQNKLDAELKRHLDENNSLKLAIRSGGVGIWDWDIKNNFLLWDDQMFLLYGLNRSNFDLNYHTWESCIHPEDRMDFSVAFQNALTGNQPLNKEFRAIWPDQSLRYIKIVGFVERDDDKNALRFVGTNWDISEEKKVELALVEYKDQLEKIVERRTVVLNELNESLSQSEALLNGMSEIGDIGGWEIKYPNNELIWTKQVFKIHEIDTDEIPSFEDGIKFYSPEVRGLLMKTLDNCTERKEPFELELPFITAKGKRIWVRTKGRPKISGGKVVGITGVFQEVTRDKHVKESLVSINEQLDQKLIERTEELDLAIKELETFTYTVSHDLRSPLRAIEGFSKALKDNYKGVLDEDGDRWLDFIMSNVDKMGVLISDILAFSRVGRSTMQPMQIDMNGLIEEKFDKLKSDYTGKIIKLNVEKLPKVVGDKQMMGQVWSNILNNALKFSSKKEEIKIEIKGKIENDFAVFTVQDYGAGFDKKYLDKLFVVFQRLHGNDEFEGSGVGLAIVDRILKKHRGWIEADGKQNEGAVITFGIPI